MEVVKFGNSSIGSVTKIKEVVALIQKEDKNVIILSTFVGTTNTLIEIADCLYRRNPAGANKIIDSFEINYEDKQRALQALSDNLF